MTVARKPVSPADMLAEIGRALYGEHWRRPLAEALGIDERQLRRWLTASGRLTVGHGLFRDALALLERRATEITAAAAILKRWQER